MDENRTEALGALRKALGLERLLGRLRAPGRPTRLRAPRPARSATPPAPKPADAAA